MHGQHNLLLTTAGYAPYTKKRAWTIHEAAALLNGEPPDLTPSQYAKYLRGELDIYGELYRRLSESISWAIERGILEPNADGNLKARDVIAWARREGLHVPLPLTGLDMPVGLSRQERILFQVIRNNPGLSVKELVDMIADLPEEPQNIALDRVYEKLLPSLRRKLGEQKFGEILGRCPGYVFKRW